ncbi:MAG TPA: hypothetical protein VMR37_05270 [Rhabdochlamydiaceae bacterium]|nr:hypothetical protein [Rhabdochlamydiaceae bacterium]
MPSWCENKLDNEYAEWLDSLCQCNIEENGCGCLSFDEWFERKREDYAESLGTDEEYA